MIVARGEAECIAYRSMIQFDNHNNGSSIDNVVYLIEERLWAAQAQWFKHFKSLDLDPNQKENLEWYGRNWNDLVYDLNQKIV